MIQSTLTTVTPNAFIQARIITAHTPWYTGGFPPSLAADTGVDTFTLYYTLQYKIHSIFVIN